jgi:hypothetical protein
MSIQFNDTSTLKGLVQLYEKEIGVPRGTISGDTNRLKEFTADVNLAWDSFLNIALPASGTWQFDDSNHTDYPIIFTNLVDGQRDYTFTTDQQSNIILDVYKVLVKSSASAPYEELEPVDQQNDDVSSYTDGQNVEGNPTSYDKTGNGIFLDPIPSANVTNGLKIYINREPSYFTSTDTTKKPGCPGIFHNYFYLHPASEYARRNTLVNQDRFAMQVAVLEDAIKRYFGKRERDVRKILTPKITPYI